MSEVTYISFYLRTNTIHIYVKAVREINSPRYVRFLVNGDEMKMVMQPYDKKDFVSFRVPNMSIKKTSGTCAGFRVHSKAFCQVLACALGWNPDMSYKVPGIIASKQRLVCFDLKRANVIARH